MGAMPTLYFHNHSLTSLDSILKVMDSMNILIIHMKGITLGVMDLKWEKKEQEKDFEEAGG
jgi:hypothetical protein